jgi:hypothetical protein
MNIDDDVAEVIEQLQLWHDNGVRQLQKILDHKSSNISIADISITAGTDMAKGLRIGVMLAIKLLGELPISLEKIGEE